MTKYGRVQKFFVLSPSFMKEINFCIFNLQSQPLHSLITTVCIAANKFIDFVQIPFKPNHLRVSVFNKRQEVLNKREGVTCKIYEGLKTRKDQPLLADNVQNNFTPTNGLLTKTEEYALENFSETFTYIN